MNPSRDLAPLNSKRDPKVFGLIPTRDAHLPPQYYTKALKGAIEARNAARYTSKFNIEDTFLQGRNILATPEKSSLRTLQPRRFSGNKDRTFLESKLIEDERNITTILDQESTYICDGNFTFRKRGRINKDLIDMTDLCYSNGPKGRIHSLDGRRYHNNPYNNPLFVQERNQLLPLLVSNGSPQSRLDVMIQRKILQNYEERRKNQNLSAFMTLQSSKLTQNPSSLHSITPSDLSHYNSSNGKSFTQARKPSKLLLHEDTQASSATVRRIEAKRGSLPEVEKNNKTGTSPGPSSLKSETPLDRKKERLMRLREILLPKSRPELITIDKPNGESSSKGKLRLMPSVYEGRPPTVLFYCREELRKAPISEHAYQVELQAPIMFKNLSDYDCIKNVFTNSGLQQADEDENWDICWGWFCVSENIQKMKKHQRFNHFPGSKALGRKDFLWKNFYKMKYKFPQDYNYMPQTFILSTDYLHFQTTQQNAPENALWIAKPVASACGKGIFLINKNSKIQQKKNYLVSNYISNPHLINGLKYDLRVYVVVTCYDPLRVYLFNEGLVRFATEKYTANKIKHRNRFSHLTNYAVNKESDQYRQNDGINQDDENASKWTFAQYRKKLTSLGLDPDNIWKDIKDVVIKTVISAESLMLDRFNRVPEHSKNCFELYGFDVLLDSELKPWLMEVNIYPSLRTDSTLDAVIKTRLVCDTFNLAGLKLRDEGETASRAGKKDGVGRYIPDLDALNEDNILEKLSPDDWEMLFESAEELQRQGDFELIFPLAENIGQYKKFFEVDRYNNLLLWKTKKMKINPLTLITPLAKR